MPAEQFAAKNGTKVADQSQLQAAYSRFEYDLTLWPGESQTIIARYSRSALRGARPVVTVSGWNVAPQTTLVK